MGAYLLFLPIGWAANSRLGAYSNKYGMRVSYSLGTGSTMRILVFMPG